ncbi:unnamed protein product [Urochloa humidicola]
MEMPLGARRCSERSRHQLFVGSGCCSRVGELWLWAGSFSIFVLVLESFLVDNEFVMYKEELLRLQCQRAWQLVKSCYQIITSKKPPNKDRKGELSAEGIAAELMFGETGIARIRISRHCHAPHTVKGFLFSPILQSSSHLQIMEDSWQERLHGS